MKFKASELIALSEEKCVIINIDGKIVSVDMFDSTPECEEVVFSVLDESWACHKDMDIQLDSRGRAIVTLTEDYPYMSDDVEVHLQIEIYIPMTVANFTKLKVGAFHVD